MIGGTKITLVEVLLGTFAITASLFDAPGLTRWIAAVGLLVRLARALETLARE